MKCDFCMSEENVIWKYDAKDYKTGIAEEQKLIGGLESIGAWAACDICSSMIECEDWDGVIKRALKYSMANMDLPSIARGIVTEKLMRSFLETLYSGFKQMRVGERERIKEV